MSYFVRALRRSVFVRLALVVMMLAMPAGQAAPRPGSAFAGAPLPAALPQDPMTTPSQCTGSVPASRSFTVSPRQARRLTHDEATLDVGAPVEGKPAQAGAGT